MFDNIDLDNHYFILNIIQLNLPVNVLGQIHIGFIFASRRQLPPLKQYGIEVLHGLRRISQNL